MMLSEGSDIEVVRTALAEQVRLEQPTELGVIDGPAHPRYDSPRAGRVLGQ